MIIREKRAVCFISGFSKSVTLFENDICKTKDGTNWIERRRCPVKRKKFFLFFISVEKVQRPSSKISSLIQDAENKSKQRKSSTENLNLLKRESPLGGEDKKADDLVNAPKLPPKPGKYFFF